MTTPDWLQQYAQQQGFDDAPAEQPNPTDVSALEQYANSFAPQQPSAPDVSDLQSAADYYDALAKTPAAIQPTPDNATYAPPPAPDTATPKPSVLLADAIPDQHSTSAQDAVKAKYLALFKQFPANGTAQQKAINKAMVSQYETELNAARAEDIKTDYATLKTAQTPQGKAAPPGQQKAGPTASNDIPIGAAAGAAGIMGAGLPIPNLLANPQQVAGPYLNGASQQIASGVRNAIDDPSTIPNAARKTNDELVHVARALPPVGVNLITHGLDTADLAQRKADAERTKKLGAPDVQGSAAPQAEGSATPPQPQGHWVNGQWVRTVSPTALGMEDKLELQRSEHAMNEADAARDLVTQRQQIYNQRSAELQAQADQARAEAQRRQTAQDKAQQDYDAAAKLSASAKIDPDRFWAERGTGARVAAILGSALGAFGASMLHEQNQVPALINDAIERDLQAQKQNAANAKNTTDNAWQKLRLATGSAQQADNLYRLAALQATQGKLDELNAGPQQRAQLDAALQQAKDTQQAKALQFRLMTEKYSPGYMVGGAPAGGADADAGNVVQLNHQFGAYAPDTHLAFKNAADAQSVKDQLTAYGIMQKARDHIAQLEQENPLDLYRPGSQANSDMQQYINSVAGQIGHLQGVKKLPIFDAENIVNSLTPSMMNAAIGASATHRADTMLQSARDTIEESINTRNPEITRRHLDVDQHGQIAPGEHYTGADVERQPMPRGFHTVGGTSAGAGTREAAPQPQRPEIRHVVNTPGKGKKKGSSTVTSVEEPDDDEESE